MSNDKPVIRDEQGRFPKGVSGNPIGRPKTDGQFRELCRKQTKKALKALVAALGVPGERVPAAKALLEFSWGKAPAAGFKSTDAAAERERLSTEAAKALLAELREQKKATESDTGAEH